MNTNPKLKGQTALVTGANSGIGKGIALALANDGAKVVVNYVTHPETAKAIVEQIENNGGVAIALKADVSKEDEVQDMFKAMYKEFGTIDILINNAGIQKDSPFEKMKIEDWQLVLNVNLTGQFLCAREAIREFLRRGIVKNTSCAAGKIICLSSVHQVIPWSGHANYAASKGAINMFMKSIAQEFAGRKIRINSIGPGAIETHINKKAWNTPSALKSLLKLIPYNRIGKPEDIGKLAVWLASDESDYITGTTVFIDGGMTLFPGFTTNG